MTVDISNKLLNAFEQSEGEGENGAVSMNNVEHLYIHRTKYGLRFIRIGLMSHVSVWLKEAFKLKLLKI